MYINTDNPTGDCKHNASLENYPSDQMKGPLVIGNLFGNISLTPDGKIKNYNVKDLASVHDSKDRIFLTPDDEAEHANNVDLQDEIEFLREELRRKDKELTELKLKQLEQTKNSLLRTTASDIDRRTKHLKDENSYLKE